MNNSNYNYNDPCGTIEAERDERANSNTSWRTHLNMMRKSQFIKYNEFFLKEMDNTVQNNNSGIYKNCIEFIKQH